MMNARGKFITLEGIEGVGKSTHCGFIAKHLRDAGKTVVETREPGGTRLGEALRGVLLDPGLPAMSPVAELLLVFAARAEHLSQVIVPALARGDWVVCDRFTDATYAYQGGGRGLDTALIGQLETLVQAELRPDATILFTAPVALGLSRAKSRGSADRFESERIEFFERVQARYLERLAVHPLRYRQIDAAQPLEAVQIELQRWVKGAVA